jgi:hypothetical protein
MERDSGILGLNRGTEICPSVEKSSSLAWKYYKPVTATHQHHKFGILLSIAVCSIPS